jgi:hypothetical protein
VLRNPVVSAPIVGATKPHHLADAAAAVEITLTSAEVGLLEQLVRIPVVRVKARGEDSQEHGERRKNDAPGSSESAGESEE